MHSVYIALMTLCFLCFIRSKAQAAFNYGAGERKVWATVCKLADNQCSYNWIVFIKQTKGQFPPRYKIASASCESATSTDGVFAFKNGNPESKTLLMKSSSCPEGKASTTFASLDFSPINLMESSSNCTLYDGVICSVTNSK